MDCPASAPFDAWDPILQRFVRSQGGGCMAAAELSPLGEAGCGSGDARESSVRATVRARALRADPFPLPIVHTGVVTRGAAATPALQPRGELLAKLRTLSPPTNLAALRVSTTPSDLRTPGSDATQPGDAGASVAWWRTGTGSTGSGSGRRRSGSNEGGGTPSAVPSVAPDPPAGSAERAEDAEEASRQLAMQLYEEEQSAFLEDYAQKLTSPDNPSRRRASGDPGSASTPHMAGQMDVEAGMASPCARGTHEHARQPRRTHALKPVPHYGDPPAPLRALQTSRCSSRGSCRQRSCSIQPTGSSGRNSRTTSPRRRASLTALVFCGILGGSSFCAARDAAGRAPSVLAPECLDSYE